MAKLILQKKDNVVAGYDLANLPPKLTIGSDPFDIIFILDANILKKQLQLEHTGTHYRIKNLQLQQAVLLNGQILDQPLPLHHQDRLTLGEYILIFHDPQPDGLAPSMSVPEALNDVTRPTLPPTETSKSLDSAASISGDASLSPARLDQTLPDRPVAISDLKRPQTPIPAYELLAIFGPYSGDRYRLKPDATTIGRDPDANDMVIRNNQKGAIDPGISRKHAMIVVQNGHYYLVDNNSRNGTYLNGSRLQVTRKHQLNDGDEIEILGQDDTNVFRFLPAGGQDFSPPRQIIGKSHPRRGQILIPALSWLLL
ncbi:FHA domain-containing protein, partial [candidate division KSB1 bacterium]|nr:FHA domain-containing protein [candidate division KSB1 bacterium]